MRHRPPVTRDARPRQLPTVSSHAVPTGEYQSDPPSLPRDIRCFSPRGHPTSRAGPLAAVNEAIRQAQELAATRMGGLTGGMDLGALGGLGL